jgi:hypothetical protein
MAVSVVGAAVAGRAGAPAGVPLVEASRVLAHPAQSVAAMRTQMPLVAVRRMVVSC